MTERQKLLRRYYDVLAEEVTCAVRIHQLIKEMERCPVEDFDQTIQALLIQVSTADTIADRRRDVQKNLLDQIYPRHEQQEPA